MRGSWRRPAPRTLPAGTVIVPMDQPLGALAMFLLEPQTDDGLVTWNLLDASLVRWEEFPVLRLRRASPAACTMP